MHVVIHVVTCVVYILSCMSSYMSLHVLYIRCHACRHTCRYMCCKQSLLVRTAGCAMVMLAARHSRWPLLLEDLLSRFSRKFSRPAGGRFAEAHHAHAHTDALARGTHACTHSCTHVRSLPRSPRSLISSRACTQAQRRSHVHARTRASAHNTRIRFWMDARVRGRSHMSTACVQLWRYLCCVLIVGWLYYERIKPRKKV